MNSIPSSSPAGSPAHSDPTLLAGGAPHLPSPPTLPNGAGAGEGDQDAMDIDQQADDGDQEYEYYDEVEDDQEWEEEEAYYIFDFGKNLTLPELRAAENECKILGLDTDNPFVQVGPAVFRGSSMESLGQDIIFAKRPSHHALDEESASKFDSNHPGRYPHLHMLHIMDRRVKMTPVRLRQKESAAGNDLPTPKPSQHPQRKQPPPTGQ